MNEQKLKKIVRAKMVAANFELEAGVVDSFMGFIKKFKIELPSKEKAEKTLQKYTDEDIKEAYASIPKMLTMFKSKKANDDNFFSVFQKELIRNMMLLICLVSITGGILPKNPNAAIDKLKTIKERYPLFDYIGKINVDEVRKIVNEKDSFETALDKIKKGIIKKELTFSDSFLDELPTGTGKIKIYEDKLTQIKSTKELLNYGGVYLKVSK